MTAADLARAAALSAAAFGIDITEPGQAARGLARLRHLLATDPGGCLVAERGARMLGVAQAALREHLWCLSLLTVDPAAQSTGAGRALFERALAHGAGAPAALIMSSSDPRALRLYALGGFTLHPTFEARGTVDPRGLPSPDPAIREGGAGDLDELAAISREIRGAAHTPELRHLLAGGSRLLRLGDRGFAVASPDRGVQLLAARDDEGAAALLVAALAGADGSERTPVRWITAEQAWAVEVLLRAGLDLVPYGALCVRGDPGPLHPYIPSPSFA
jgi:GNAT superfamily N-acetyltransferase